MTTDNTKDASTDRPSRRKYLSYSDLQRYLWNGHTTVPDDAEAKVRNIDTDDDQ